MALDSGEAAKWARRAAEQGYPAGQADLAYLYEQGKGVPLDYVAAYTWYSLAAAGGENHSPARLKSLTRIMLSAQLRTTKARVSDQAQAPSKAAIVLGNHNPNSMSFLPKN